MGKRKPADLAACGFMKCGAGITADRQLRWMRSVLLKTLSLSETAWADSTRTLCQVYDLRQLVRRAAAWSARRPRRGRLQREPPAAGCRGFSANGHLPTNPVSTPRCG